MSNANGEAILSGVPNLLLKTTSIMEVVFVMNERYVQATSFIANSMLYYLHMKTKRKKLLIFSIVGLILFLIMLLTVFKLGIFDFSSTQSSQNVNYNPDYIDRPQSEFAVGGTLSNGSYTPLSLDLANCPFGQDSVGYGFGHTVFAVDGIKDTNCVFRYGSEIENPRWDGKLTSECEVPVTLLLDLSVDNYGIDLSPIEEYCSRI